MASMGGPGQPGNPLQKTPDEIAREEKEKQLTDAFPKVDALIALIEDLQQGKLDATAEETTKGLDTPGKLFNYRITEARTVAAEIELLLQDPLLQTFANRAVMEGLLKVTGEQIENLAKSPVIDVPSAVIDPMVDIMRGAKVRGLDSKDQALIEGIINTFKGKPEDEWVGLGDIARFIGKKPKIAERILKALVADGAIEQKSGINEFRRKKKSTPAATGTAASGPALQQALASTPGSIDKLQQGKDNFTLRGITVGDIIVRTSGERWRVVSADLASNQVHIESEAQVGGQAAASVHDGFDNLFADDSWIASIEKGGALAQKNQPTSLDIGGYQFLVDGAISKLNARSRALLPDIIAFIDAYNAGGALSIDELKVAITGIAGLKKGKLDDLMNALATDGILVPAGNQGKYKKGPELDAVVVAKKAAAATPPNATGAPAAPTGAAGSNLIQVPPNTPKTPDQQALDNFRKWKVAVGNIIVDKNGERSEVIKIDEASNQFVYEVTDTGGVKRAIDTTLTAVFADDSWIDKIENSTLGKPPFDVDQARTEGEKLSSIYSSFRRLLVDAERGRGLAPDKWKQLRDGITGFVAQVKVLEKAGLPITSEVKDLEGDLQSSVKGSRVEKPDVARIAMDGLEKTLKDIFRKYAKPGTAAPSGPSPASEEFTGAPGKTPERRQLLDLFAKFNDEMGKIGDLLTLDAQKGLDDDQARELFARLHEVIKFGEEIIQSGLPISDLTRGAYENLFNYVRDENIGSSRELRQAVSALSSSLKQSFDSYDFVITKPKDVPPPAPVPPVIPAAPKQQAIEVGLLPDGNFNVKKGNAFANAVFNDFFTKFEAARNPGAEAFDASEPKHDERFERALEAYALWRNAIKKFTAEAKATIGRDLGMEPLGEDLIGFEDELGKLAIADGSQVQQMIRRIDEYKDLEEDEARREQEIRELGGIDKLKEEVEEMKKQRDQKKAEADNFINSLNVLSRQGSDIKHAWELKKLGWRANSKAPKNEKFTDQIFREAEDFGNNVRRGRHSLVDGVTDRIKGVMSGSSFGERLKGLFRGKEAVDLEKRLRGTYGIGVKQAANAYPGVRKSERNAELQTEKAITEYEMIEKQYLSVKSRLEQAEAAQQAKDLIAGQFRQLRSHVFADTEAFKTAARLTAGRSRDVIKGMLDPAVVAEDKIPEAAGKAEKQFSYMRNAADFSFTRGRYNTIPEISMDSASGAEAGEYILEASETLNATVKLQIQKSVEKLAVINGANADLVRKTLLAYGKRGYEVGEQVLSDAIKREKNAMTPEANQRANVLQALLFELRSTPRP